MSKPSLRQKSFMTFLREKLHQLDNSSPNYGTRSIYGFRSKKSKRVGKVKKSNRVTKGVGKVKKSKRVSKVKKSKI